MSSKTAYMDSGAQLGAKSAGMAGASSAGGDGGAPSGGVNVDPQLKSDIQAFLDWVKDSEGLSGYITYYLQQNNAQIITSLSQIYTELRTIFGV